MQQTSQEMLIGNTHFGTCDLLWWLWHLHSSAWQFPLALMHMYSYTPIPTTLWYSHCWDRANSMGAAQVQSLTPTPLKHFGPLKGGVGGGWDQKPPPSSSRHGRGGLRVQHTTIEVSTLPPHQCRGGCSRPHTWRGGGALTMERPLWYGPTPKRVPHRVPKRVRPFLPFRASHHHLMGCPVPSPTRGATPNHGSPYP